MLNRYSAMFVLVIFSHMAFSMDTPPESPKPFGVHTDLNSFFKMLQQSPQRVAAVTAFFTKTEGLSQAAEKGSSVRVVSQPYALKKGLSGANMQGIPANVHDKVYFVRGKDGHGHGFMGSANLTNNQWNSHETVLSWKSPDRTLPGFTRHFTQLMPDSSIEVRQRQSAAALRIDALFKDVATTQVASAFPWMFPRQSAEELDMHFVDDSLETPPLTPKLRRRSGGREIEANASGGKRARSRDSENVRPLKRTKSSQLRPNAQAFTRPSNITPSPFRSPLRLVEGSPSTRLKKTDSTKRCELISSFDFKNGDLIPWLGHRITEKKKCDYFLSTMTLNHPDFIKKIQEAAKAGSRFKILVDKKAVEKVKSRDKYPLFKLVGVPNVKIRSISGKGRFGLQHSKVFTRKPLDRKSGGLSIVSTANFTKESSQQSNYLVSLPEKASKKESFDALEQQFLDRWNQASVVK